MMAAPSSNSLSPMNDILKVLRAVYRDTQQTPVRTVAVATRYGMSESNMRRYLKKLVLAGQAQRIGVCGGYIPREED